MTLSEAIEAATKIIGSYPSAGTAGKSYIGTLASTLASYPRSVALDAADQIAREIRGFPLPQIADVVAWCENRTEPLRLRAERDKRVEEQFAERERFSISDPSPTRGRQFNYKEFQEMVLRGEVKRRPIGRFE